MSKILPQNPPDFSAWSEVSGCKWSILCRESENELVVRVLKVYTMSVSALDEHMYV